MYELQRSTLAPCQQPFLRPELVNLPGQILQAYATRFREVILNAYRVGPADGIDLGATMRELFRCRRLNGFRVR